MKSTDKMMSIPDTYAMRGAVMLITPEVEAKLCPSVEKCFSVNLGSGTKWLFLPSGMVKFSEEAVVIYQIDTV